ncbi:MAG: translocation/assembly module TamB domain-containing protein [Gracilimonas sp.]|uniref:translocation/assembly module TamB domain-containing protein n=1 Tax=Gracilimonas TaxID=649462 RepID=UPI001B04C72C|nr:translocation/assembly module TamB domain-containing protein [Gracilimonas sp.]MBO6584636.1 translocation/assembly module TamB domain-containing protein [Gracilimonas sp.]MBO6616093.1 translocation/assembly module TamB domain-containing protein [Gracilimonas sp.]
MSEKNTHIMVRILKVTGWTLLALFILGAALRLSLKTSPVHNLAKNKITSLANQQLNGTLSIGDIDGDLWNDFIVTSITLQQTDTLASIDTLGIRYNIWSLLNSSFQAQQIRVNGLNASIIEEADTTFNVQNLVKEAEPTQPSSESAFGLYLEKILVENSSVFVRSSSYLPDSALTIENLNASAGFYLDEEISGSLSSLSFKVKEGRLPSAIAVETAGSYQNQEITLNRLVVETGRSLLNASAFANLQDSTFNARAETNPFSLIDLQAYLQNDIPAQELQLGLKVGGSADSLHIEVTAEGEGFDEFLAITDLSFSGAPTLKKLGISAQNIDVGYFTNDSVKAYVEGFQATVEGQITQNYQNMNATWGYTLSGIRYQDYVFEEFFGSGTIANEELRANFELSDGEDRIIANPSVQQLFDEHPSWQVPVVVSNLDIGWWLQNPELNGKLSLRGRFDGKGFQPSEQPWTFRLYPSSSAKSRPAFVNKPGEPKRMIPHVGTDTLTINGQVISDFNIQGSVTKDSLKAGGFVQLIDSKISFNSAVADYLGEAPSYSYNVNTLSFNASEIAGVEDLPTSINLKADGFGRYFDPDKIELQSNLLIDSSYVNGAAFDRLNIMANLNGNILTISEGDLNSEVIEGTFSGRRNLQDQSDPMNKLAVDMKIKNLQPLASVLGIQLLSAQGTVTGNITEKEKRLQFDGNVDLQDFKYDTLLSAQSIEGNTLIGIGDNYSYDLTLNFGQPAYSDFALQDIHFETIGIASPDSMNGTFMLDIESDDAGEITQSGNYEINLASLRTHLMWQKFDFTTPARVLSLQSPFRLTYQDATIQTDTLHLQSDGGTYLTMAIPYADSLKQEGWIRGRDFDFGVIQEIIFDERFVDGILSGNMRFANSPQDLSGDGLLTFTNLAYQGTEVDTMNLNFSLVAERLKAELGLKMNGEEKVSGRLDVPFVAADPASLDDSFFEEPVSGQFVINPVQLSEFQNLLNAFGITGTRGILSFNGVLSGTAGEPDMEGIFQLADPTLSGIKIDSAFAEFRYHHQQKNVTANAEIRAQGQQAASIRSELPISVDFRTLSMNMPDEDDSLYISMVTDDFNLSVFNDFLDKQYMNKLRGMLNADIKIAGTKSTLTPEGYLRLDKGELSVPIAGIKLTQIKSELDFNESGLRLKELTARSGSGRFNANGSIAMEGITPTNLNIDAKATRFRLANTSDYNLTIDLDSKLSGKPTRPEASGELRVKNGFVYLQDFGERSVETVELEGEETSSFSAYDSLSIDMRFVIERNFLIRNRRYLDMEIALTGELDAQKQVEQDLQLFGTLNAQRGYVRPLGKQFTLDEGTFTFSGPVTNPDLFIKTSYVPQSSQKQGDPIILYYIIEGQAEDPDFRFESTPQMEQQDIVCYTLFNKPCYALESWQQVVSGSSGSSPTDLLVDVLLDEFETLATQQLGIDVVQIDNSGANGNPSIKTGWYLNRRTFFAIVNEISGATPETLFILEYLLTKNLDLILTQGDDNRQGIDIRWQYDY